ncbi:diacylglycerol/lipid kinase family protein [Roseospira marina]|nr:diacylglycerol kinase family protein [Roseospira marina]MBB4314164.1 YegS/Rv2252/BmrU family lipid kinase [Roseospira marina]MBB5087325.1 YegS/Rv2252/BmrU family lipid kinase [Roseospira marina]
MARRSALVVIANPTAGGGSARQLARALAALRALGCAPALWHTEGPGDAIPLAARAAREGAGVVVAAGGDGTVAEVAAGLLDARRATGAPGPALGLLPSGTVNVLARDIGLPPRAPEAAARVLHAGHRRVLRPGRLNGRPFVAVASVGIDSQVVRRINGALKKHTGVLAYLWALVREMPAYTFPSITVEMEGLADERETLVGSLVVVARSRLYGGPLTALPGADVGDDCLHVLVLRRGGRPALARYGLGLLTGRLAGMEGVERRAARRVTLHAADPLPLQADGDLAGTLPAVAHVDTGDTLDLIVPASPRGQHPHPS